MLGIGPEYDITGLKVLHEFPLAPGNDLTVGSEYDGSHPSVLGKTYGSTTDIEVPQIIIPLAAVHEIC